MDKLFQIEAYQDFELVVHELIHNLTYCSSKTGEAQLLLGSNEFKAAGNDVRKLIFESNFDFKKVEEAMELKDWDKGKVKYFISLLEKESIKVLHASLNHHISEYGEVITESDWLLKLVLGTSEQNTIKYPLLQLVLSTVSSNGVQRKRLFELNKDVLRKTIESLEIVTGES